MSALLSQQCHGQKRADGGQRHGNGEEHRPIPPLIHRQVAHELSGLSVHGKKEVLAAPFRIEHPHGYERVTALLFSWMAQTA